MVRWLFVFCVLIVKKVIASYSFKDIVMLDKRLNDKEILYICNVAFLLFGRDFWSTRKGVE